jgi:outer membrane lipoprotein carrier protein
MRAAEDGRAQLERFLRDASSLSATFDQSLFDERGELLEQSSGTVYLKRPGRFRWDYTEPYQQSIITDGATLWFYDKDLAQVTVAELNASEDSPAVLLGAAVDLDSNYEVTELPAEQDVMWVELMPRREASEENQYSSIRLGLRDAQLVSMDMRDNFGQRTLIEFGQARSAVALDDSLFEFEPPEGVDVVQAPNAAPPAE